MLWPLVVYFFFVLMVVAGMVIIPQLVGQRHKDRATGEPYESGIVSTGGARIRLHAHFYLIAMIFVIFDLEAVFILAWAVAARDLGWVGYAEIVVFIVFLLVAFVYLWRMGCFTIHPNSQKKTVEVPTVE